MHTSFLQCTHASGFYPIILSTSCNVTVTDLEENIEKLSLVGIHIAAAEALIGLFIHFSSGLCSKANACHEKHFYAYGYIIIQSDMSIMSMSQRIAYQLSVQNKK